MVKELTGRERTASLQSHTTFETASLYKLFLEDYLYNQVEQNKLSLDSYWGTGNRGTLASCLELMIVVSDNACAESLGYSVGWGTLHNFARNAGFADTTLSWDLRTSAWDMTDFLARLNSGNLMNSDHTQTLLTNMKKQIYRSAIPAGVPGVSVADKVGFRDSYWNDAAIVYGSKSTYIIVVLSKGSGTAPISNLSSRVYKFLNQ
jgi:beta-lactamase class A